MHVPIRRVLAVFLLLLTGLVLLSIGVAGAQSEAPVKPPAAPPVTPPEPDAVDGDDNRVLKDNKALAGRIVPASDVDNYYVFGTAGQTITLNMIRTGGSLDGFMELYDQVTNTTVAWDDDSGDGLNPRISNVTLPRSGRYRVILSSWNNSSTGTYNIIADLSGNDANDNRLLPHGKILNGNINPASDRDSYFFWADAGDVVTIAMWKNGGALDTYLELYDEFGNFVASDDDSGAGFDSLISNVHLGNSGFYHVVARSFAGSSSGLYKIRRTTN